MNARHLAVLLLGIAAISTGASLFRLAADVPALSKAAWRLLLSVALLLPLCLAREPWRHQLLSLLSQRWRTAVLAGLALALHFGLWVPSLDLTSVASSVILVTLSPIFVSLAAPLTGETVGAKLRFGVAVAVSGAIVIALGDAEMGGHRLLGDAMALGGAIAAALYFLLGRRVRADVALIPYVTAVYGVAALALTMIALASGAPMVGFDARSWILLALLALLPQILGHTSFNWALAGLSATFVTVATLGEPIGSTLLAWWWLGESPPASALAGGALVLCGLALATRAEAAATRAPAHSSATGR